MYQTKIAQASGRYATDIYGASLYNIGNNMLHPGDYVMTDGQCIYGRHGNQGIPELSTVDIYPFYNPNCAAEAIFSASSAGALCGMSEGGNVNELATNIRQIDGYNNFCVAGRNVVYFVQARDHGYMAYNLNTGASFVINSDKMNSAVLDACVDDNGNLLVAFRRISDDWKNDGNGVLVFKNDSILHDDKPMSGGTYQNKELGYVPHFLHLRTDGTYVGVFAYHSFFNESDADRPASSTSVIDAPVNIYEQIISFDKNGDILTITKQEWDNTSVHLFPELKDTNCVIISGAAYSHWRAVLYDSQNNETQEIMHVVSTTSATYHFIENNNPPVENHKYPTDKIRKHDDADSYEGDETYTVKFANSAFNDDFKSVETYSVEAHDFSILLGDACEMKFEHLSVSDYIAMMGIPLVSAGEMGFMNPAFTSKVSVLGLEKNIGQSSIIDVKKTAGGYLILTSDGVYESDGTTARMLCPDFKCWNNNFRLNRVSRSSQSWSMASKGS